MPSLKWFQSNPIVSILILFFHCCIMKPNIQNLIQQMQNLTRQGQAVSWNLLGSDMLWYCGDVWMFAVVSVWTIQSINTSWPYISPGRWRWHCWAIIYSSFTLSFCLWRTIPNNKVFFIEINYRNWLGSLCLRAINTWIIYLSPPILQS